ncbi:MAG: Segregation and condensation protein A [Candidatus Moranbacteria bacterium GW2011_GWA2_39_41]|nr:MAG: Segregation and condensation protein A [Candidatus Moranbacteria bacterium GW2011_GWA2_39_41]
MIYNIKTDKFEGPMDLLLELIEKEKLNITELSLAHVTDQYLEYIKGDTNIKLGHLAEFLSIAAKLILIKSRALLPLLTFTEEEEAEIKDLAKQLEEYKKFKDASIVLGKMSEAGKISYDRAGFVGVQTLFYPPEDLNVYDFKKYFLLVLNEIPIIEKLDEEVVQEVITLEERINDLQNTLRQRVEMSFTELTSGAENKIDVIISFLAMLEMVKQRIVDVEQGELFDEIQLKHKMVSSPNL